MNVWFLLCVMVLMAESILVHCVIIEETLKDLRWKPKWSVGEWFELFFLVSIVCASIGMLIWSTIQTGLLVLHK